MHAQVHDHQFIARVIAMIHPLANSSLSSQLANNEKQVVANIITRQKCKLCKFKLLGGLSNIYFCMQVIAVVGACMHGLMVAMAAYSSIIIIATVLWLNSNTIHLSALLSLKKRY